MQSNGGLIELPAAAGHASWTVLSGPAGGAAGAAYRRPRGRCTPTRSASTWAAPPATSAWSTTAPSRSRAPATIAGRPLALPMVAVHTVGAGGGSIAWRDPGGALRVGPRSAGADPGPACYGRGGTEPTVTDANLVLGYLAPDAPLAGGVQLDLDAARAAVGALAQELGLEIAECAEGIVRVANAEMLRALRVVTVERGIDPRRYALLCVRRRRRPLHAASDRRRARASARSSARARRACWPRSGLVVSPRRRDVQRSVFLAGDELSAEAIAEVVDELAAQAREQLGDGDQVQLSAMFELRYRGRRSSCRSQTSRTPIRRELRERFEALHEERYGYRDADQELELVTLRVSATIPGTDVELGADASADSAQPAPERDPPPTRTATLDGDRSSFRCCAALRHPGPSSGTGRGRAGRVDAAGGAGLGRRGRRAPARSTSRSETRWIRSSFRS